MEDYKRFTLIELLLVLTLFAIASTIAMNTMMGVIEASYVDVTVQNLKAIEQAVLGRSDSLEPEGYVAEMGLPPTQLEHLWKNPDVLERPFGKKIAPDGSGVELYCGWRGPYLKLPIGHNQLLDGWGNAFDLLDQEGVPLSRGAPIEIIRSLGADRQAGGAEGFDHDIAVAFTATSKAVHGMSGVPFKQDFYRAVIDVFVRYEDKHLATGVIDPLSVNGTIVLRYYYPDATTGEVTYSDTLISAPFVPGENFKRSIGATAGARAIRAFQSNGLTTFSSKIHSLKLRRGNQSGEIEIVINKS